MQFGGSGCRGCVAFACGHSVNRQSSTNDGIACVGRRGFFGTVAAKIAGALWSSVRSRNVAHLTTFTIGALVLR